MVSAYLRPERRRVNCGDIADSGKNAVFTSNQLSHELETYSPRSTNNTPSLLLTGAIEDLGYLIHGRQVKLGSISGPALKTNIKRD